MCGLNRGSRNEKQECPMYRKLFELCIMKLRPKGILNKKSENRNQLYRLAHLHTNVFISFARTYFFFFAWCLITLFAL